MRDYQGKSKHGNVCMCAVRVLVPMPRMLRGTIDVRCGIGGRAGGTAWATASSKCCVVQSNYGDAV